MFRKTILTIIPGILFLINIIHASPIINIEDHPPAIIEMNQLVPDHQPSHSEIKALKKQEHHLVYVEKELKRLSKKLGSLQKRHTLGGFSDPVDKWFWIWIVSWGFGLLLTLLFSGSLTGAAIGIIWLLAFGLGTVSLLLWLVKKFG